jgi:hypothetical protein
VRQSRIVIFGVPSYIIMSDRVTKSKSSRATSKKEDNPSLILAKNIADLSKALNNTGKAWDALQTAREDIETKFELEMRDRKRRFDESDADYEQKRKSQKLDLQLELRKHGRESACEVLKATNEVAIDQDELGKLRRAAVQNADDMKNAVSEAVAKCKQDAARDMQRQALEFDKKEAQNTAQIEQLKAQCSSLKTQASDAQENLDKERQLMRDLVESMKSPPIVQNYGK